MRVHGHNSGKPVGALIPSKMVQRQLIVGDRHFILANEAVTDQWAVPGKRRPMSTEQIFAEARKFNVDVQLVDQYPVMRGEVVK